MSGTTILLVVIAVLGYAGTFVLWMKRRRTGNGRAQPNQQRVSVFADVNELFEGAHPVMSRPLLRSPAERSAWLWLRYDVFPKHNVLPKAPFTRFTLLRDPVLSKKWFEVLSSIYCTFTICSDAGLTIGCVDLLPAGEEKRSLVSFKRRLLEQCGMHYRVITIGQLPEAQTLREEFLGKETDALEAVSTQEQQAARIEAVREQLHRRLEESRQRRAAASNATPTQPPASFEPTDWGRGPDSFLAELDPEDEEYAEESADKDEDGNKSGDKEKGDNS